MAVQNIPSAEHDSVNQPLVGTAVELIAGRWREFPPDFLTELYRRATPDDLEPYRAEELAAIGEQSWTFLQERKPGASKIEFAPARLTPGVMVLDVLNDD